MIEEVTLRPIQIEDAALLAGLYSSQRDFLAPFEPVRGDEFYTIQGQRNELERSLALEQAGLGKRMLIRVGQEPAGVIAISHIVLGAFRSAYIGYFVSQEFNGCGVATRAVGKICEVAFEDLGLHRLEAGTLTDNIASQRVLEKNQFERIGISRRHLMIAGRWRDHVIFSRINDAGEPLM
jgi:ribosomal-protein-alanine N-acetyltransferase